MAWEESRHNVNVVGHDAPCRKPVVLALPEAQGCNHGTRDAIVEEWARASAAIKILFDACPVIAGEQGLLLGKKIGVSLFGGCKDVMTFGDLYKHR